MLITKNQIKDKAYKNWINEYQEYLENSMGINTDLAGKISVFLLYCYFYGLTWNLTSGFRDPKYQKELQARWDSGDRSGLVTRPATNSKHSNTSWLGKPDSLAIDIKFNDDNLAGQLSPFFGLKWGGNFRSPDKVHYYV